MRARAQPTQSLLVFVPMVLSVRLQATASAAPGHGDGTAARSWRCSTRPGVRTTTDHRCASESVPRARKPPAAVGACSRAAAKKHVVASARTTWRRTGGPGQEACTGSRRRTSRRWPSPWLRRQCRGRNQQSSGDVEAECRYPAGCSRAADLTRESLVKITNSDRAASRCARARVPAGAYGRVPRTMTLGPKSTRAGRGAGDRHGAAHACGGDDESALRRRQARYNTTPTLGTRARAR